MARVFVPIFGSSGDFIPSSGTPTTITLSAAWGSEVSAGGTKFTGDGSDFCGGDGVSSYRVAERFDITSLPATATVTLVELLINVSTAGGGAALWDIDGYNGTGLGNPETDDGATMFAACAITGVYVNDTTSFRTTGLKTLDLGATALADVEAARDAGTIFTVAVRETTDTASNNHCEFSEYIDGTNPPKLRITYTP